MPSDRELIQIVDSAMAEAVHKSGAWVVCRPGCCECCMGPFPITPRDAVRLREGLAALARIDPARAARVRDRARRSAARITAEFPEDPVGAVLSIDEAAEDELCPALDPAAKTCDLYESRPITCRTFGPAVRFGSGALAVCELCYVGATAAEIAACEVSVDPDDMEGELPADTNGGETIVAFALCDSI